jgi:hypoxanthine phosphoribosyltransferase
VPSNRCWLPAKVAVSKVVDSLELVASRLLRKERPDLTLSAQQRHKPLYRLIPFLPSGLHRLCCSNGTMPISPPLMEQTIAEHAGIFTGTDTTNMFDPTSEQPADWMRFSTTRAVEWRDIDAVIDSTCEAVRNEATLLVAILRAGSPIAALLARKTGLPVDYLLCSRRNPHPRFIDGTDRAPRGHRILLIDDVSGTGWTFERARMYCEGLGNAVKTFSIYWCEAPGMFRPDYGLPMAADTYLRWPWEYQREPEMPAGFRLKDV